MYEFVKSVPGDDRHKVDTNSRWNPRSVIKFFVRPMTRSAIRATLLRPPTVTIPAPLFRMLMPPAAGFRYVVQAQCPFLPGLNGVPFALKLLAPSLDSFSKTFCVDGAPLKRFLQLLCK